MTVFTRPTLSDQHAIVTGGARGIGAAISRSLSQMGARVTIMGRDRAALERHARSLDDVHTVTCDVSDESSVREAFADARAKFGDAYVLVNNAGQATSEKFVNTTREIWDQMLSVNLTSVYLCTRQVLPAMLKAERGRIVNVASIAGVKAAPRMSAYSAAKHGVVGLTKSIALETAKFGITVNAICPGYTDTDMTERGVRELMEAKHISRDEARAMITRVIPRGTMTTPDEVAHAVAWLCGPLASGVTGQAIVVAGGEAT